MVSCIIANGSLPDFCLKQSSGTRRIPGIHEPMLKLKSGLHGRNSRLQGLFDILRLTGLVVGDNQSIQWRVWYFLDISSLYLLNAA